MTVRLDAVREAIRAERQRCVEIVEACCDAGQPTRAEAFVANGTTVRDVRCALATPAPAAQPQRRPAFDPAAIPPRLQ